MLSLKQLRIVNLASHKESIYDFRENKLSIINGINLDTAPFKYSILSVEEILEKILLHLNLKLPSNGSGKSAVLEGLNLVFFGEPVRKSINARDLIRTGEEFLLVELLCSNDWLNLPEIKITRQIFANKSKPQSLVVVEGTKNITKPSIDILNKYILDYYIGISKVDIINFFMIQKDRYKPFLLLSDTEKKEMISRFTGIDKYNYIENEINQKILSKSQTLKEQELVRATIIGKIELSEEEIDLLPKEKDFTKFIQDKVDILEESKNKLSESIKEISKSKEISEKKLKSTVDLKKHWEKRKIKFDNYLNPYKQKLEEIEVDKGILKEQEEEKNTSLTKVRKNKQAESLNISKLGGFLESTTKCPDCKFEFSIATTKSLKEIKEELDISKKNKLKYEKNEKDILEELKEFVTIKEDIKEEESNQEKNNKKFKSLGDFIEKQIKVYVKLENDIEKILNDIALSIQSTENKITLSKEEISNVKLSNYKDILEQKNIKQKALKVLKDDKVGIDELIILSEKDIQDHRDALIIYNNFKNYLYNKTIFNIEQIVNFYISKFSNLVIKIKGDKLLADGKTQRNEINVVVERDKEIISYYLLSSGEKTAIDTSFILAFQQIINGNSQNGLNYICLDEVISSVDPFNATELCKVLDSFNKTINIISHVPILGTFETTYIIKKDKKSNIINLKKQDNYGTESK